MSEEDDKATVVIDISALRKEKEKKEKDIAELAGSLEFSVETPKKTAVPKPNASTSPSSEGVQVVFFEFGGSTFAELGSMLPADSKIINDLPTLNGWLKKKIPLVVVFAFDVNPKAVNQLCAQLNAKFKHVRSIIVAKKLSPEKVKMHKSSPAGAAAYLPMPFTKNELSRALMPLTVKAS